MSECGDVVSDPSEERRRVPPEGILQRSVLVGRICGEQVEALVGDVEAATVE